MGIVSKEHIYFKDHDTDFRDHFITDVLVDASGMFYCRPREDVFSALVGNNSLLTENGGSTTIHRKRPGTVGAITLVGLRRILTKGLEICNNTPEITKERVILYVIDSHISFAEQSDGTIVPNAGYPNAKWVIDTPFGAHHASKPAENGYSMHVGARAYTKITKRFGAKFETFYKKYYGEDENGNPLGHFERDHPAGRLNSWCSFDMKDPKEIPYTDEAAKFFDGLMIGMAELQRKIQSIVKDRDVFIDYINTKANLLGLADT